MIAISEDDKALILGDYRTGKTTLAQRLVLMARRHLVWDPRQDIFRQGLRDLKAVEAEFAKTGRAIYHPGRGDILRKFDEFCEFALKQHSALVFIDEPASLGSAHQLPQSFRDLHRLGHARGLGVMLATHSVWDLPHVMHQANHLFIFQITRPVDLNVLGQMVSAEAIEWIKTAPRFWFWHRGGGHDGPVSPLPRQLPTAPPPPAAAIPAPPPGPPPVAQPPPATQKQVNTP